MKRHACALVLLAGAGLLGSACFGKHRPPVLANTPGGNGAAPTDSGSRRPVEQPLDAGPDVRSIGNDSATSSDFPTSDAATEDGPLTDVQFDLDRATLNEAARGILEKHALWLQSHRESKVTVEGHCDERGTTDYNLALGEQRAKAAKEYLVSLGVLEARLRTVSYGKERPLDRGNNEAAWARNRRAHFAVSR
jgi:peptidoglycan-associated lipoprotein